MQAFLLVLLFLYWYGQGHREWLHWIFLNDYDDLDEVMRSILFSLLLFFSTSSVAEQLLVAVASNFIQPAKELGDLYERKTGIKIKWVVASSGKHYAQIIHGAPYDVFLSADQVKVAKLIRVNAAHSDTRITYAQGQLALYSPYQNLQSVEAALSATKKFAIANPKLAPYGAAAHSYLQKLSVYEKMLSNKSLVIGENINQAYQFVETGNAQAGLVAYSQLNSQKKNTYRVIDTKLYPAILQDGVVLSRSKKSQQARNFISFLQQQDATDVIKKYGYLIP